MPIRDIELSEGRSLHAATGGEGPDILLLHGALATSQDWVAGPLDGLVREGFRVTAVDRPGHGRSRRPRFEGTPRDQAGQLCAGFDALGIVRPLVVAHSFGALVALAMAERFAHQVAGLVLIAPVAFPEPRPLEHLLLAPRAVPLLGPLLSLGARATFDRPLLEAVQRLMFSPQQIPDRWKDSFPYDQVIDSEAMVFEGEDAAAMLPFAAAGTIELRRVTAPVQILTGTADRIVDPARHARPLARALPQARLTEIEGVGHMLHIVRPELVVEAVRETAVHCNEAPPSLSGAPAR